jgi:hypothetical protein
MSKSIEFDLSPLIKRLDVMQKVQVPYAASLALNATANVVRQELNAATGSYFDQPNNYTRTAFRYLRSDKRNLTAEVFAETGRARYLDVQVGGGLRAGKKYEGLLRALGAGKIRATSQLLPARSIRNAAGNPRRRVFADLQQGDARKYFIGVPRSARRRSAGIYLRRPGSLRALFLQLDQRPRYQPRFPVPQLGEQVAQRVFPGEFEKAMKRALNT